AGSGALGRDAADRPGALGARDPDHRHRVRIARRADPLAERTARRRARAARDRGSPRAVPRLRRPVIDLHSHVLPGLDDGAADVEEALAICRAAVDDGIEVLAGTPHVRDDHPTTADRMEAAIAELRDAAG